MAEMILDYLFTPVRWVSWILALPVRALTGIIVFVKSRNPQISEKTKCPGCGFTGSNGGPSIRMNFVRTTGGEKAMIELDCLRCSAKFYVNTILPPDKWLAPLPTAAEQKVAAAKKAAAETTL